MAPPISREVPEKTRIIAQPSLCRKSAKDAPSFTAFWHAIISSTRPLAASRIFSSIESHLLLLGGGHIH
jgi:hypothetical protein